MSATTILVLLAAGLPVALGLVVVGLVVVVRRHAAELAQLRRWRHDEYTPRAMAHGERLAALEVRTGLPVGDDLPARLRKALSSELPS